VNVPVNVEVNLRPGEAARPRWAVLALPLACLAGFALTVTLDVLTPDSGPGVTLAPGYGWSYSFLGLLLAAFAAVVLLQDVRHGFAWVLAWVGAFWAVDGLAQAHVRFGISPDGALPAMNLALWVLNRLTAFLPVTIAVLLLVFPTGRFLPGRWGAPVAPPCSACACPCWS
jgi:hypothetical protein